MSEERDNGLHVGHFPCPECLSENNLSVYLHELEDGSEQYDGTCWTPGCKSYFSNDDLVESGVLSGDFEVDKSKLPPKREPIDTDQWVNLRDRTKEFVQYRGIRSETMKFFGHRTEVDARGNITCVYYPETNYERSHDTVKSLMGFKSRVLPKQFGMRNVGLTGRSNELSGQHLFRNKTGKYILIVGGENDKAAAYQILKDSQRDSEYDSIPVVSPTTGEGSAYKQIADNYDFLDQFDWIVVGMDNDDAGHKATNSIVEHLPKEKVKIAKWSMKDPHSMLEAGKHKQMVRDFYSAKEFNTSILKSSSDIIDEIGDVLLSQKITLPPYMHVMEKNMKRAFSTTGRVVNIIGTTSCGKSTHVNNMTYHWIMGEGLKPLIYSGEMVAGEYALDLLSIHLEKNLDWFETGQDAYDYLHLPEVMEMYEDLFTDELGRERFRIIDDRDGDIYQLQKDIESGVKQHSCNIVIIDVLSDLIRYLPTDEQERHMAWQKNFVKSGVSIVNVNHTVKPDRDKEGKVRDISEYDCLGSGTIPQSAHINIVLNRNKIDDDPVASNTTRVMMPKCRRGTTGPAGEWYYDGQTRKIYDKQDWLDNNRTPTEV